MRLHDAGCADAIRLRMPEIDIISTYLVNVKARKRKKKRIAVSGNWETEENSYI